MESGGPAELLPTSDHVSDRLVSDQIARIIDKYHEEPLPSDARMLGLAAGQGYAEMHLATALHIDPAHVTLVDSHFSKSAKSRLKTEFPKMEVVDSDLFDFLATTPATENDIVTVLGAEFLFNPADTAKFISLLPRVMRQRGVVVISPFVGQEDPSPFWTAHGFRPLSPITTFRKPGVGSTMMYVLNSKQRA
jgi:hypothetical protein